MKDGGELIQMPKFRQRNCSGHEQTMDRFDKRPAPENVLNTQLSQYLDERVQV